MAILSVIGGMDPSGGAGILRDLWVIQAIHPKSLVDCACSGLTSQGRGQARLLLGPHPGWAQQLSRLQGEVWKIGWLPEAAVAPLVAELAARASRPRVVLDPVARASDGGLSGASSRTLEELWSLCHVVTPNAAEAIALGARPGPGQGPWRLSSAMQGPRWWIKSVRAEKAWIEDELHLAQGVYRLRHCRLEGPDPRGTGCALSSALASYLAGACLPLLSESTVRGWNGTRWVPAQPLAPALSRELAPVLAGLRWLSQARGRVHRSERGSWHLPWSIDQEA